MLALRSLARSVPRVASQLTLRAAPRQILPFSRTFCFGKLSQPSQLSPLSRFTASFSSSASRRQSNDETLAIALENELKIEKDVGANSQQGLAKISLEGWDIVDNPGEEEVALVKKDNNETIRVVFSIADVNNDAAYAQDDAAYEDEELTEGQEIAQAPEDSVEHQQYDDAPLPVKLSIQVTKSDKSGALLIEAIAQDGRINLTDFWHLKDSDMLSPKNFDIEKKRLEQYAGPVFVNLDDELQAEMQNYIETRGINEQLANFVTEYIDAKEQKEYVQWLQNLKDFIS